MTATENDEIRISNPNNRKAKQTQYRRKSKNESSRSRLKHWSSFQFHHLKIALDCFRIQVRNSWILANS